MKQKTVNVTGLLVIRNLTHQLTMEMHGIHACDYS